MNVQLPGDEERRLSNGYTDGNRGVSDETQAKVFEIYKRIGNMLRTHRVTDFDSSMLVNRMAQEMGAKTAARNFLSFPRIKPSFAFGLVSVVIVLGIVFALSHFTKMWTSGPVRNIEFLSKDSVDFATIPFLWELRLQHGDSVIVPSDVEARLELADGSIVACSAETQIGVQIDDERRITLDTGSISVNAARDADRRMIVKTACGDVEVVGTVFWVEVVRED